jgi:hypothetical protein
MRSRAISESPNRFELAQRLQLEVKPIRTFKNQAKEEDIIKWL